MHWLFSAFFRRKESSEILKMYSYLVFLVHLALLLLCLLGTWAYQADLKTSRKCVKKILRQVGEKKHQGSDLRVMLVEDVSAQLQGKRKFWWCQKCESSIYQKVKMFFFSSAKAEKVFRLNISQQRFLSQKIFFSSTFPFSGTGRCREKGA